MDKKQNHLFSKKMGNIVSIGLVVSAFIVLTAFTPVESKNAVLASKKTSKAKKDDSSVWDVFLGKSDESSEKNYAEENSLEFENQKKTFVQQGYLASTDDAGNIIKIKEVKPLDAKITVKLDEITATKPDKKGYIEVTVPYTIRVYKSLAVSSDTYLDFRTRCWYTYPDFMDSYTGNMICSYHWWDYKPDEDYDPGITTVEWGDKSYIVYDMKGDTKDNLYGTEYKETGWESDGLHYENEDILYFKHIFRVPKDYDGLTMVIMKECTKEYAVASIEDTEDIIYETNGYNVFDKKLYHGLNLTKDDFYFIKISDYMEVDE
ncbi:hypothetical protein BXO88_05315 [Oribacterium sp. C9]|uniref:hypothetical protein n=1 Tax=Oribacterium sp. C9 TaxID=1943579 RepID=UPI00098EF3BE|nr:hypothetical protein [Oribacterium sp. C9]OON86963.1 hypothetical protein BXO88_05315 [Oribacterium sp. C9]